MAVMQIVTVGDANDAVLHRQAARVRNFGPELHSVLDDMLETMRDAPGVGLAAPQVGLGIRATVIEYPEDEDDPESLRVYELINPEIIKSKGSENGQEGCLSIPGIVADVDRATYVLVRAQDRHGNEYRIKAYDWLARIFQHEIDHLHGVLMIDKSTQLYSLEENEEGKLVAVPLGEPQPEETEQTTSLQVIGLIADQKGRDAIRQPVLVLATKISLVLNDDRDRTLRREIAGLVHNRDAQRVIAIGQIERVDTAK